MQNTHLNTGRYFYWKCVKLITLPEIALFKVNGLINSQMNWRLEVPRGQDTNSEKKLDWVLDLCKVYSDQVASRFTA